MGKYTGQACVACGKLFEEQDDVVVCPICGAPHHRACYLQENHCALEEKHVQGHQWTEQQPKSWGEQNESKFDGEASLRCPSCNTLNPYGAIFCQLCGTKLNPPEQASRQEFYQQEQQTPPPIPFPPFTTPYGGLSAEDEINGISAKDMVLYVGPNSYYFLPKFKDMAQRGRNFGWNWSAFFFHFFYYFFRKMYLVGGILLGVFLAIYLVFLTGPTLDFVSAVSNAMQASSAPTVSESLTIFSSELTEIQRFVFSQPEVIAATNRLNRATQIVNFALLGFRIFCSMFANWFYMRKACKDIPPIVQQHQDPTLPLAQKGRTSFTVPLILILLYGAAMMGFFLFTAF